MNLEEQLKQGETRFREIFENLAAVKGKNYAAGALLISEYLSFGIALTDYDAPPAIHHFYNHILKSIGKFTLDTVYDRATPKPDHEKFAAEFFTNIEALHQSMVLTIRKEKK